MAMVTVCGYPCSGKTTRAQQLAAFLKCRLNDPATPARHRSASKVVLINDESLGVSKAAYDGQCTLALLHSLTQLIKVARRDRADTRAEKPARAALFSAVQRSLARNTIVVVDAMNYIKGSRYQMYCAAREIGVRTCTLFVATPPEKCREWNTQRAESSRYAEATLDNLISRFEEPNSAARWDAPLITLAFDDPALDSRPASDADAEGAVGGSEAVQRIWTAITEGEIKPPNVATQVRLKRQFVQLHARTASSVEFGEEEVTSSTRLVHVAQFSDPRLFPSFISLALCYIAACYWQTSRTATMTSSAPTTAPPTLPNPSLPSPRLPLELIDLIIDYCDEPIRWVGELSKERLKTLAALSRVSKWFKQRVQPLLFKRIVVEYPLNLANITPADTQLLETLRTNATLRAAVLAVEVHFIDRLAEFERKKYVKTMRTRWKSALQELINVHTVTFQGEGEFIGNRVNPALWKCVPPKTGTIDLIKLSIKPDELLEGYRSLKQSPSKPLLVVSNQYLAQFKQLFSASGVKHIAFVASSDPRSPYMQASKSPVFLVLFPFSTLLSSTRSRDTRPSPVAVVVPCNLGRSTLTSKPPSRVLLIQLLVRLLTLKPNNGTDKAECGR
ncbi:hypothetical protein RTG_02406 [Rhodotorula toruloides ATCC 204091]|uniref:Uncharacterized protein n=2 Tax=Rhodotorula toruloides TaxID=5286 RepID=A0A0K3CCM3_RHOTO|nr:hypothetical protein RTG_02406 [Rhodotorula toruloides ATCC 204091]